MDEGDSISNIPEEELNVMSVGRVGEHNNKKFFQQPNSLGIDPSIHPYNKSTTGPQDNSDLSNITFAKSISTGNVKRNKKEIKAPEPIQEEEPSFSDDKTHKEKPHESSPDNRKAVRSSHMEIEGVEFELRNPSLISPTKQQAKPNDQPTREPSFYRTKNIQ